MTPRVATVLSARPWEAALVAAARDTAAVRLVLRAYQPDDIERQRSDIDVVVAGGETSWVTPAQIAAWRRSGLRVVGMHPPGDEPSRSLLEAGGAHELVTDDTPAEAVLQLIRFLRPTTAGEAAPKIGKVVAITGPRGAPGRTEVALALGWLWSRHHPTVLIDVDVEAPSLAVRLGCPPRPDLTDLADRVRETGELSGDAVQRVGKLAVVAGSHRPGEPELRAALVEDVVEAGATGFDLTLLDLGPARSDERLVKRADHAVLVCDASAVGLVRAARAAAEWAGPPPALILNRVAHRDRREALVAARRATGLDPVALIPERPSVRVAARAARPPDRALLRALRRMGAPV